MFNINIGICLNNANTLLRVAFLFVIIFIFII